AQGWREGEEEEPTVSEAAEKIRSWDARGESSRDSSKTSRISGQEVKGLALGNTWVSKLERSEGDLEDLAAQDRGQRESGSETWLLGSDPE
ncbi:hypothetical protein P7K49_024308, partial [Saguinus oedipus]